MLKRFGLWRKSLHGPTIHNASDRLNQILSPQGKLRAQVDKEELKAFLRGEIVPIMKGSAVDAVLPTELVRRDLCLLCREAAYAAAVLDANPHGSFVQTLVNFIAEDAERMNFLQRMTTTQVSKILEYLTFIQLDMADADKCFPPLISRLNFQNLHNLSRVMFCFSERGYTDLNIQLIVPAYSGKSWSSFPVGENAQYSPAAEAVRILRALSKSSRMYIEQYYPLATTAEDLYVAPQISGKTAHSSSGISLLSAGFPLSSFHIFRNHLIGFILSHHSELRGAHWVNCSRALLNFPPVLQTLTGFEASSEVLQRLSVHIGGGRSSHDRESGLMVSPNLRWQCADIAEYAISNVFAHVEMIGKTASQRHEGATPSASAVAKSGELENKKDDSAEQKMEKEIIDNSVASGNLENDREKKVSSALGNGALSDVRDAFDCNPADLLKLLQQLVAFPSSPTMDARIEKLVDCLIQGSPDLSFENIVKLLTVVRSLPSVPQVRASAPEIARVASEKLLQRPVKMVLKKEKFSNIVQLGTMIYACRLKEVPEFVEFMRNAVTFVSPKELTLDYVVALLNSLSILRTRPTDGDITLNLVSKVVENTIPSHPLLKSYPEQSVKMMRAFVLQSITPPASVLHGFFGTSGLWSLYAEDSMNRGNHTQSSRSKLLESGAVTVFDMSRSLAYVSRHSREVKRQDLDSLAWEIGMKGSVLPILLEWNTIMRVTPAKKDYVPLSWRCVLETCAPFLDVTLDSHSLQMLTARLTSVYDSLKQILSGAAVCTQKQVKALLSLSSQGRKERLPRITFKNNTMIHFISSMLSFEYYLFQSAWQEKQYYQQLEGKEKEDEIGRSSSLSPSHGIVATFSEPRPLANLVEDYKNNFLYKQVFDIDDPAKRKLLSFSPMQVIRTIFYDDESGEKSLKEGMAAGTDTVSVSTTKNDSGSTASISSSSMKNSSSHTPTSGPPMLNRDQILEITTHLPFSIALVMQPGPLNDYFVEKSYSSMLAGVKV